MCFISFVFGWCTAQRRFDPLRGKSFAEGWLDPALQKSGLPGPRTFEVIHTRPVSSNIGLCTFALLFQIGSVPQYGDGPMTCGGDEGGMFGSRSVTGTLLTVWVFGSRTGM